MVPCGTCKTVVSEEIIASFIRVIRDCQMVTLFLALRFLSTDKGGETFFRNVYSYKSHTA
jgi:hypothetical protein